MDFNFNLFQLFLPPSFCKVRQAGRHPFNLSPHQVACLVVIVVVMVMAAVASSLKCYNVAARERELTH